MRLVRFFFGMILRLTFAALGTCAGMFTAVALSSVLPVWMRDWLEADAYTIRPGWILPRIFFLWLMLVGVGAALGLTLARRGEAWIVRRVRGS